MLGLDAPRILTPDQRPRVFVSSTLQELADERADARAAIESLRLIPVMFELGARPHPARALYRAYLAQSHVFVGVYYARYGWVAPGEDVSGLEDEYRLSAGMPRLVYLKSPAPDREPRLGDLLARIRDDDTVSYKSFATREELGELLRDDLAVLLAERFLTPGSELDGTSWQAPGFPGARPLPTPVSSLLGRETEVTTVQGLLTSGARLVTLVGPGGIGKTRVALETARRLADDGSARVAFVPLESIDDPAAVLPEVAACIGLGLDGGLAPLDALGAALSDRPSLLVVDNFEQVQAAAPDIAALLARCPEVSILATSRAPLKVRGEQLVPVGPLELHADHGPAGLDASPAVQLFVDRARSVRPTFALADAEEAGLVAEICRRLDGIPLAIELAAARSTLLTPRALLDHVGTALDLGSGASDLPARQRTLRDTLAWSLRLLSPAQSAMLARLSLFLAPWTLPDAQPVADPGSGDILDDLAVLVENNLVAPAPDASGEPRFRLYESVRAYAGELLDAAGRAEAEAAYVARLSARADELARLIRSSEHRRWMTEFRLVWPDLRRAWELVVEAGDAERTVLASMSLLPLWLEGRGREAADLVSASLRLADEQRPPRHSDLLIVAAQVATSSGDFGQSALLLNRIGDDVPEPTDRAMLGALPLVRGFLAADLGDLETCARELRRSVEVLDSDEHPESGWVQAYAHTGLGALLALRGDIDGAIEEFTASCVLGRRFGNLAAEMESLVLQAELLVASGRRDQANELLTQACDLLELQPFYEGNAYCLEATAAYAVAGGHPTEAARLLGLAGAVRAVIGALIWPLLEPTSTLIHDQVRGAMDGPAFDQAYAEGMALDPGLAAATCRAVLALPAGD
jgi:predicted ATPase